MSWSSHGSEAEVETFEASKLQLGPAIKLRTACESAIGEWGASPLIGGAPHSGLTAHDGPLQGSIMKLRFLFGFSSTYVRNR